MVLASPVAFAFPWGFIFGFPCSFFVLFLGPSVLLPALTDLDFRFLLCPPLLLSLLELLLELSLLDSGIRIQKLH